MGDQEGNDIADRVGRGQTAIIIGAGPAGLTAAYELLTRTGIKPIVLEKQLKLWDWISYYYICGPGEVMNAAYLLR